VGNKVKVGIIGCGNIFDQYVKGCRMFDILEVYACTDIDMSRAKEKAAKFDIPHVYSVPELLTDPDIQMVINLTVPQAHVEVSLQIIAAGKHVHSEKPLALNREDGKKILDAAKAKGVLVGCAPDTFLGGGLQTCRKLIDDGVIGTPIAATAFMLSRGPESWHPNPEFFYKVGGGPMFDMGPYYLTTLVFLLGPVKRLSGTARISFPERVAHTGQHITVDIPTHVAGTLEFEKGAVGTLITSFDVWGHNLPRIEIYGEKGTLSVPDPNTFGGPVRLLKGGSRTWEEVSLTHDSSVLRGIGPADMAYAIGSKRAPRASGELAYHVLDLMQSFHDASANGHYVNVASTCAQPEPLPANLPQGVLET
jgi:predicted dehydrogenase